MTFVKQLWDTNAALDTDWLQPPYWGALKAGKLASDYMPAWMRGFVRDETKSPDQGLIERTTGERINPGRVDPSRSAAIRQGTFPHTRAIERRDLARSTRLR